MTSYLYTWNPKRWHWWDRADAIFRVNEGEQYYSSWSCGNTKSIEVGDSFFLMKLGEEPKGIVGCGYVFSTPEELPHWDKDKAAAGETSLRADLLFKALADDPIVTLATLKDRYAEYNWTPQAGGLKVPDHISNELFTELQENTVYKFNALSPSKIKEYFEGKIKKVTYKTYDRSSKARQDCINKFGYSCEVCGFNFENKYGEIGATYVEVHHLMPIAGVGEEYKVNPIKDLRPVCSNCHRMLHRKRPPLSIEELKRIIDKNSKT